VVGILLERPLVEDPAAHLAWAHALVRDWFLAKFASPTEPQIEGWPPILAGKDTLISAPTGSGKTLAAFLACIDRLVRKALDGRLQDCTEVLYISPLKALGNDIQKNLEVPLGEIQALAGERGLLMPTLRAAVRTGDTLMHERRALLKKPPHILVTTPESLYILLTTESGVRALRHVETVIVDEIHAIADDKRGAHLALSLERLVHTTRIVGGPVRIGLSATQRPIELVAGFLTGSARPNPVIVDTGHRRKFDLAVEISASAWERQILARRILDMPPGVGRCSTQASRRNATARWKRPAGCCCIAMAWFSANCSRAKPACRAGANCRWPSAAWKTAEKFAADDSSQALLVSSLRSQWLSNRCANCGGWS
jgi:Lhr-like helicase